MLVGLVVFPVVALLQDVAPLADHQTLMPLLYAVDCTLADALVTQSDNYYDEVD